MAEQLTQIVSFTDRSRQEEFKRCNRARYLGYEWGGRGLRKVRQIIPLATGIFTHVGLGDLLEQILRLDPSGQDPYVWRRVKVDAAVKRATDAYKAEMKKRALDVELGEDGAYTADEQVALTEAMLRAYCVKGLGDLLEQYEVLEVEQEELWPTFVAPALYERIDMQGRLDALLRERSSGDFYICSFKTAATWDHRKDGEARHDVQGLSEAVLVERRLKLWHAELHEEGRSAAQLPSNRTAAILRESPDPPRIMGIQMVHLIKGKRDKDEYTGRWQTRSHLLRAWKREGITAPEFAWSWKWAGPEVNERTGNLVGHTLGKGWRLTDVFDPNESFGGVKGWIDALAAGTIQEEAGDPFSDTYVQPLPYFRQDQDLVDWQEQAMNQEWRVHDSVKAVESIRQFQPETLRSALNAMFPQNRRSCDWPSRCQFLDICFGDPSMLISPLSSGLYELRVPHHAAELDAQKAAARALVESNREEVARAAEGME